MATTTRFDNSLMGQHHQQYPHQQTSHHTQLSTKTMIIATVVGVTVGGPLLALTAFFFLSTMALFVVASPLLLIFSPLLVVAGFVITAALAGFGAAGLLAIAGLSALGWVSRSVRSGQLQHGIESVTGKLMETGENVKESVKNTGKEWAGQLKQTADQNSADYGTTNKNFGTTNKNATDYGTTIRA